MGTWRLGTGPDLDPYIWSTWQHTLWTSQSLGLILFCKKIHVRFSNREAICEDVRCWCSSRCVPRHATPCPDWNWAWGDKGGGERSERQSLYLSGWLEAGWPCSPAGAWISTKPQAPMRKSPAEEDGIEKKRKTSQRIPCHTLYLLSGFSALWDGHPCTPSHNPSC